MMSTPYSPDALFTLVQQCHERWQIWAVKGEYPSTGHKKEVLEKGMIQCQFAHWEEDSLSIGDRPIATDRKNCQRGGRYKPIVTVPT